MAKLNADEIINLIEAPPDPNLYRYAVWWTTKDAILHRASTAEMIKAIEISRRNFTKWLLCYMLCKRADAAAADALTDLLSHPNRRIRIMAEEALAEIERYQHNKFTPDKIIQSYEQAENKFARMYEISYRADIFDIIEAIEQSTNQLTQTEFLRILGFRQDERSLPALVRLLQSDKRKIQIYAADAIDHFDILDDTFSLPVQDIKYDAQTLINLLYDEEELLRGISALVLGELRVVEAGDHLERILPDTKNLAAIKCIKTALKKIVEVQTSS